VRRLRIAGNAVPYQYYKLAGTERGAGASVHSFDVEQLLLKAMSIEGWVRLCTEASPDHCGKQDSQHAAPSYPRQTTSNHRLVHQVPSTSKGVT
jgi:hypothetical protein